MEGPEVISIGIIMEYYILKIRELEEDPGSSSFLCIFHQDIIAFDDDIGLK